MRRSPIVKSPELARYPQTLHTVECLRGRPASGPRVTSELPHLCEPDERDSLATLIGVAAPKASHVG